MPGSQVIPEPSSLETIFIFWGGNSYYPEYALEYINGVDVELQQSIRNEMDVIIKKGQANCSLLNRLSGNIGFQEDAKAAKFFEAVYEFLFNNGQEPDIDEYL